jgi:hypothetical protein
MLRDLLLRIERRQKTLLPRLLTLCVWISALRRELLGGGETLLHRPATSTTDPFCIDFPSAVTDPLQVGLFRGLLSIRCADTLGHFPPVLSHLD